MPVIVEESVELTLIYAPGGPGQSYLTGRKINCDSDHEFLAALTHFVLCPSETNLFSASLKFSYNKDLWQSASTHDDAFTRTQKTPIYKTQPGKNDFHHQVFISGDRHPLVEDPGRINKFFSMKSPSPDLIAASSSEAPSMFSLGRSTVSSRGAGGHSVGLSPGRLPSSSALFSGH